MSNTGSLCERCRENAALPDDFLCADCTAEILQLLRDMRHKHPRAAAALRSEEK